MGISSTHTHNAFRNIPGVTINGAPCKYLDMTPNRFHTSLYINFKGGEYSCLAVDPSLSYFELVLMN